MRKKALALVALLVAVAPAAGAKSNISPPFETGKKWKLEVNPGLTADRSDIQKFEEVMVFEDGKAITPEWSKRGFAPGPFKAEKDGDKWLFETTQTCPTQGTAVWKGDVRDGWFKGVIIWTPTKGRDRMLSFAGQEVREGKK